MSTVKWEVGQTVDVQSRTWSGINKPGGCAKITKVHYATDGLHVESVDVKYVLGGGFEKEIDPAIVSPFETLKREGRKRRGRDFLMGRAEDVVKKVKQAMSNKKTTTTAKTNNRPPVPNTRTTADQRDHSTSPSTPVTPEHPSLIKASKPSKSVSSMTVPSYVIADTSSVEVSPLQDPLNRTTDESKKTSIARRGLFGVSKTKTEKSILPAKENRKDPNVGHAEDDGLSCSTSSPRAPQTSQEVRRAHSAAVKLSLSKKQNKSVAQTASWTDRKQATVAVSKKTSSLKNVFDQELRKAREFLDDVCRAPHKDIEEEHVDPTSKETRLDTSGSEPDDEDDKKPAASTVRREEFLNLFRSFRRIFDDEDGTMDEAAFRTLIVQKAVTPFSAKELDENLEYLFQEGKLMRSDGVLYIID